LETGERSGVKLRTQRRPYCPRSDYQEVVLSMYAPGADAGERDRGRDDARFHFATRGAGPPMPRDVPAVTIEERSRLFDDDARPRSTRVTRPAAPAERLLPERPPVRHLGQPVVLMVDHEAAMLRM